VVRPKLPYYTVAMSNARGVLYIKWGSPLDAILNRSLQSLHAIHPELPVHIVKFPDNTDIMAKSTMFDLSPFEETLFLDVDTVVLSRLDFAFEAAQRHGIACCISECPWARRYAVLSNAGDVIEYNTGVVFFTRAAKAVFDLWRDSAPKIDSSCRFYADNELRVGYNDQSPFAYAVRQLQFNPYVLPQNWNLRPAWQRIFWGPLKIWHAYEDVPPSVVEFTRQQEQPGAIICSAALS
jgi:hypothetical protein